MTGRLSTFMGTDWSTLDRSRLKLLFDKVDAAISGWERVRLTHRLTDDIVSEGQIILAGAKREASSSQV